MASVTLPLDSLRTVPGAVFHLRADLRDGANTLLTSERVQWSSTDTAIATVDTLGRVTAKTTGFTHIIAASGAHADTLLLRMGEITFTNISAGAYHACGLTPDSTAYCWGVGREGELGISDTISVPAPVEVVTGIKFSQVGAGYYHSCGLSTSGAVYCWGGNGEGQMGLGAADSRFHLVPEPVVGGGTYVSLSVGERVSCVLTTAGTAKCWGNGEGGAIGDGDTARVVAAPTVVSGGLTFRTTSTGIGATCAITADSTGYCWGATTPCDTLLCSLTPQPVPGGFKFISLSASGLASCGVTADGASWCWGDNGYGQLGISLDTTQSAVPVRVSGSALFAKIYPGVHHSCALASSGAAYCWGDDSGGQLGPGGPPTSIAGNGPGSTQPLPVSGGLVFNSLSTAYYYTCGVTTTHGAYCWGLDQNGQGQMGSGTYGGRIILNSPTKVFGQP